MQPTRSYFVILSALCLATIALAGDPPKPNPPTSYSVSLFTFSRNGYEATRTYYNQTTKSARTDTFDQNFNPVSEFIGFWAHKRGYMYNSTTGQCQVIALTSPWANTWDILNNATFSGVETTYKGEKCVMWVTALDNNKELNSCFNENTPVYFSLYDGGNVVFLSFVTSFSPDVDPSVFEVPGSCGFGVTPQSPMNSHNLKKYKVPAHPLLF